ncbi:MAG: hypothetical protein AB7I18_04645 [Candidatus Berkiella sp.]
MKLLQEDQLLAIGGGCSACQHRMISVTAGSFVGTLSAMGVAAGTFMLGASTPVVVVSGVVTFAGVGYYAFDYFQHSAGIQAL